MLTYMSMEWVDERETTVRGILVDWVVLAVWPSALPPQAESRSSAAVTIHRIVSFITAAPSLSSDCSIKFNPIVFAS